MHIMRRGAVGRRQTRRAGSGTDEWQRMGVAWMLHVLFCVDLTNWIKITAVSPRIHVAHGATAPARIGN